jgi:IS1 family transposase
MDEIYTFVKKHQRAVFWTAYSRQQGCVITYVIGEGIEVAMSFAERSSRLEAKSK